MKDRSLYDALCDNAEDGRIPFHMPGHKRKERFAGILPYSMDITEIDGFDDLHDPSGMLLSLENRMSRLWNVTRAVPLVCGSTGGILSGIRSLASFGDTVILDRRCHKSVHNAVEVCGLEPHYIKTNSDLEFDLPLPPSPDDVAKALDEAPRTTLVVITSPTYEGMIADIPHISKIVHSHGAKLLVDQAHGAHLDLSPFFVGSAAGYADITVISLHKTLPSMTQTAALLLSESVDASIVASNVSVFETSSPSYVLLASIDRCVDLLASDGNEMFDEYSKRLDKFYADCRNLENLRLLEKEHHDKGKIVISCKGTNIDGTQLARMLRDDHNIEPEMVMPTYVLAMSTVADDDHDFAALSRALCEIDKMIKSDDSSDDLNFNDILFPRRLCSPCHAARLEGEYVDFHDAVGRLSLDYVYAYPPGAPLITPGEVTTAEIADRISHLIAHSLHVYAAKQKFPEMLVAKDQKAVDKMKKV